MKLLLSTYTENHIEQKFTSTLTSINSDIVVGRGLFNGKPTCALSNLAFT